MLSARSARLVGTLAVLAASLTACAGTTGSGASGSPGAGVATGFLSGFPTEPSAASQPASAVASAGEPAGEPAGDAADVGPCALLDAATIKAVVGGVMPDGQESIDDARQVQMCTWTSTDPVVIAVVALTDVDAQEAFDLNVELAPAYFEGEAVPTTVPGAEQAYAVHQPDVGWVVGAIASDRFVQVQVGGEAVTQEQVEALSAEAISRLAS